MFKFSKPDDPTSKELLNAIDQAIARFRMQTVQPVKCVLLSRRVAGIIGHKRMRKNTFGVPLVVTMAPSLLIQVTSGEKTLTVTFKSKLLNG